MIKEAMYLNIAVKGIMTILKQLDQDRTIGSITEKEVKAVLKKQFKDTKDSLP